MSLAHHSSQIASSGSFAKSSGHVRTQSRQPANKYRSFSLSHATPILMLAVSIVALALSSYLSWAAITSSKVAGCASGQVFDCNHVLHSKWSTVFGVPVGVPATFLYTAMTASLLVMISSKRRRRQTIAQSVLAIGAIAAALAALWFISLQLFVVRHLCSYCLAAHVCGLILAGLVIWTTPFSRTRFASFAVLGIAAVSVLAMSQVMADAPPTYQIETHPASTSIKETPGTETQEGVFSAPGSGSGDSQSKADSENIFEAPGEGSADDSKNQSAALPITNFDFQMAGLIANPFMALIGTPVQQNQDDRSAEKSKRLISINGGQTKLKLADWPVAGKLDAPHAFVEMFDYTCPHCRENHKSVKAAAQQLGVDNVAIVALAVPMDRKCNPTVATTHPKHAEACELAKIGIAVWRLDQDKFASFHDWLFRGTAPPNADAARKHAEQLVGKKELSKELASGMPAKYIASQVKLYQQLGGGTVPKMLFPKATVTGKISSPDALIEIIRKNL